MTEVTNTSYIQKPTLTFDAIDRQRTLKEPLRTTKHSSEQSKDFTGYSKRRCTDICIKKKKKLDEMGHQHLLLDEMGLDEMGLDEMGINR